MEPRWGSLFFAHYNPVCAVRHWALEWNCFAVHSSVVSRKFLLTIPQRILICRSGLTPRSHETASKQSRRKAAPTAENHHFSIRIRIRIGRHRGTKAQRGSALRRAGGEGRRPRAPIRNWGKGERSRSGSRLWGCKCALLSLHTELCTLNSFPSFTPTALNSKAQRRAAHAGSPIVPMFEPQRGSTNYETGCWMLDAGCLKALKQP